MKTINPKTEKEQRFLSEDAIALMSMLPEGLTEEWQEKAFKVFGRTKAELAAPELLDALEWIIKTNSSISVNGYEKANNALTKATK